MKRTAREIRADLAICDGAERWSERYHDAVVRLLHDVEPLLDAHTKVERLCKSFDPTSGSGRTRAFVSDVRVALGAAVTPTRCVDEALAAEVERRIANDDGRRYTLDEVCSELQRETERPKATTPTDDARASGGSFQSMRSPHDA